MLLETYTTLEAEAMTQRLPSFLNVVKEVTGKPEYSMFNLSLLEDWSKTTKFCVNIAGKDRSSLSTSSDRGPTNTNTTANNTTTNTTTTTSSSNSFSLDHQDWDTDRRASECDNDWEDWAKKMVNNLPDDCDGEEEEDEDILRKTREDDRFYDDIDKRYNGTRTGCAAKQTDLSENADALKGLAIR